MCIDNNLELADKTKEFYVVHTKHVKSLKLLTNTPTPAQVTIKS